MRSMLTSLAVTACLVGVAGGLSGCGFSSTTTISTSSSSKSATPESKPGKDVAKETAADDAKKIAAAFKDLSEEDRKEATAQKFCAVAGESLLGSMGPPVKVMIEGQPVFLCCDHCAETAQKDPKATLAKVAELKKQSAG